MNDQVKAAVENVTAAADALVAVTGTAMPTVPVSLCDKLRAIPDGTKAAPGGRPLAVVQTRNGPRGVFWKGNGKGNAGPSIGVRKIKQNGGLYRRNKYDGTFFVTINKLEAEGRNS
jgi:hypothetical protein